MDSVHSFSPPSSSILTQATSVDCALMPSRVVDVASPQEVQIRKTLQNDLLTYIQLTEKKSGVSVERALRYIEQGQAFLARLRGGELDSCSREEKRSFALPFTWYLFSRAISKGEGFKQGMLVFEDPDHRILNFFGSAASTRLSSHYRGRVLGSNFGIDIPNGLPYKFQTVLFGGLSVLDSASGEWLFWKPEDHGVESLWQLFLHSLDYLASLKELIGREQGPLDHKEDLLPLFRKHKRALKAAGFSMALLNKHSWGISGLIAALKPLMDNPERVAQLSEAKKGKIISFLNDLLRQYDWVDVRHGNEVVIADRIDSFRFSLIQLLTRLEHYTNTQK